MLRHAFFESLENFDIEVPKQTDKESDFMAKIPKIDFYADGIDFTLNDICLLHSYLVKIDICKPALNTSIEDVKYIKNATLQTNDPLNNQIKCNHRPIDILLFNMLEKFPQDKPAAIWERLKDDLNNEPRQLDIEEALDEIGEKELYWYDIEGEAQSLKRKSFYNLIRNFKNI